MKIDDYFSSVERGLRQNPNLIKPHHKHISPSDRLAPADQPSLSQVFVEIEGLLDQ